MLEMKTYHKIQTVFLRDPKTNYKTLLEGNWAAPEFNYLKDNEWICTEKIDGTNIRVMWDGENISFAGKTDNAQIPQSLLKHLENTFTLEKMKDLFNDIPNVCLYGEGYGAKIQKGDNYLPDSTSFILFDIKVGDWWQPYKTCRDMSEFLNIPIVPIVGIWNIEMAVEYVRQGFTSIIAHNELYMAEGLVMKPAIDLFSRSGQRIITKIKHKDFKTK
jgi:ATP-dependent RNA circularization protein (DNA/RNA ligase family)